MKRTLYLISIVTALSVTAVSCMKDGEMLVATIDGNEVSNIGSADQNIVLTQENSASLVLSLYWDELGKISLSNPDAQTTNDIMKSSVQFAAEEEFLKTEETEIEAGTFYKQFKGADLNRILSRLEYAGGVEAPLFIRMKTSLGDNAEPKYGEILEINVTPYVSDMTKLHILGYSGGELNGDVSYIPATGDREYEGFFVAPSGWYNCFFMEGDGTYWGAYTDGNPFPIEQKANTWSWNVWFPEPSGCYYVTMSTSAAEWTATAIQSVTAGPDGTAMTFSGNNQAYRGVITTTSDNTGIDVTFSGDLYDKTNGTSSSSGTSVFGISAGTDGTFTRTDTGSPTGITAPQAGTYTLFLHIGTMLWELKEGDVPFEGEEEDPDLWPADPDYSIPSESFVYLWDTDNNHNLNSVSGKLAATEAGVYSGFAFNKGNWYNFLFGDSDDAATSESYGSAPVSDGLYRLYCGSDKYNIWFNTEETEYVYITADMNKREWGYEKVTGIYLTGYDNKWNLDDSQDLTFDATDKTWSIEIEASGWGDYGIKFVVNTWAGGDTWGMDLSDKDGDGKLSASTESFTPSTAIESGKKYKVTIDLNDPENMTYTIGIVE